ncbi:reverse transcriptase domain-containing protein [Paenibacillus sepulcri]|uniref:Reverse transcriptase domain-containing protein n=1 Tax=Paenibacillus sepulcri TaxID=359917 RepID=A0ABS7BW54_9BACL|nr:hypothetical protein [Paenibacillus sepulcri]
MEAACGSLVFPQSLTASSSKPSPSNFQSLFEPLFPDGSYGYRPERSAQQAIRKVKAYAEQGCGHAVEIDLSKYFDTLNHELLLNLLRKQIQDKRVIDLIKKYLKSGVMENGVRRGTEEGSPQGGPMSPLLANIYLIAIRRWKAEV